RVLVREHRAAGGHLELVDELEETAVGECVHLARVHEVPDRDRAVVFDLGLDLDDVANVHAPPPALARGGLSFTARGRDQAARRRQYSTSSTSWPVGSRK